MGLRATKFQIITAHKPLVVMIYGDFFDGGGEGLSFLTNQITIFDWLRVNLIHFYRQRVTEKVCGHFEFGCVDFFFFFNPFQEVCL